jgi:hypothetical protein
MAKLQVQYDPNHKQMVYTIRFNPSIHAVEEASTFRDSFEGCLDFVMEQFEERTRLVPHMQPFTLEVEGDLPRKQKTILERVVSLYNRSPELYNTFSDTQSFQNLAEYFGHAQPNTNSSSKK